MVSTSTRTAHNYGYGEARRTFPMPSPPGASTSSAQSAPPRRTTVPLTLSSAHDAGLVLEGAPAGQQSSSPSDTKPVFTPVQSDAPLAQSFRLVVLRLPRAVTHSTLQQIVAYSELGIDYIPHCATDEESGRRLLAAETRAAVLTFDSAPSAALARRDLTRYFEERGHHDVRIRDVDELIRANHSTSSPISSTPPSSKLSQHPQPVRSLNGVAGYSNTFSVSTDKQTEVQGPSHSSFASSGAFVYPRSQMTLTDSNALDTRQLESQLQSMELGADNVPSTGQRNIGKSLIGDISSDDNDGTNLLNEAFDYAKNDERNLGLRTAPEFFPGYEVDLRLNTTNAPPAPSSQAQYTSPMLIQSGPPIPLSPRNGTSRVTAYPPTNPRHSVRRPPARPQDQHPPCNTLYVGNLQNNTSEEELKALFSRQRGYKRMVVRAKSNASGPMCFVEFEDITCASKTLDELYGHTLSTSTSDGIRLSFSKNPLGVRSEQTANHNRGGQYRNGQGNTWSRSPYVLTKRPPPGFTYPVYNPSPAPTFADATGWYENSSPHISTGFDNPATSLNMRIRDETGHPAAVYQMNNQSWGGYRLDQNGNPIAFPQNGNTQFGPQTFFQH